MTDSELHRAVEFWRAKYDEAETKLSSAQAEIASLRFDLNLRLDDVRGRDERIATLETLNQGGRDLARSQQNIIDAYEKSMTAIREALGLSEFDDHELVIDEINLKLALLATQAERIAELERNVEIAENYAVTLIEEKKALTSRLGRARNLIANAMHEEYPGPLMAEALDALESAVEERCPHVADPSKLDRCKKCGAELDPESGIAVEGREPDEWPLRATLTCDVPGCGTQLLIRSDKPVQVADGPWKCPRHCRQTLPAVERRFPSEGQSFELDSYFGKATVRVGDKVKFSGGDEWVIGEPHGSIYSPSNIGGVPCFRCYPVGKVPNGLERYVEADGSVVMCGDSIAGAMARVSEGTGP